MHPSFAVIGGHFRIPQLRIIKSTIKWIESPAQMSANSRREVDGRSTVHRLNLCHPLSEKVAAQHTANPHNCSVRYNRSFYYHIHRQRLNRPEFAGSYLVQVTPPWSGFPAWHSCWLRRKSRRALPPPHRLVAIATPASASASAPHSRHPNGSPSAAADVSTPTTGTSSDPIVTNDAGSRFSAANQVM
jgi:hypothetical protein